MCAKFGVIQISQTWFSRSVDCKIMSFLNQNPECASCRYQWRKCIPDCPMHLPHVQHLFGVSNVIKLIAKFEKPGERVAAMISIEQEANVRARDPILGSYGIQLTFCRAQHHRHLHGGSSFGTNSMHAPPPPPLLPLPPPALAPAAAYSLPWMVEDPMEQQQQKDFLNAWLTMMVA
ncbi:hypothetical protein AMTRI_Chr05g69440 [Amborella trichopoda]